MAIHTTVDVSKNLMEHTFTDNVSLTSIVETIDATLVHPLYSPGMNMMWFCEDGVEVEISTDDPLSISNYARKKFDQFGKDYRVALVANDDLAFGMLRMYQSWSDDRPIEMHVFRKKDAAYAWVMS